MVHANDPRIPVVFGGVPQPGDMLLVMPGAAPAGLAATALIPSHPGAIGCACCPPHSGAARTLSRLFVDRARGTVPFFDRLRVQLDTAETQAVRAALVGDVLASARFRLA